MEDPQNATVSELASLDRMARTFSLLSPPALFSEASTILLDPTHRGSQQALRLSTMSRVDQLLLSRFQGGLSLNQSLILLTPDLLALMTFSAAAFFLSHLIFVRQEVRSA
jgi:ABC-type transport system involved in multi-copper enzyme maturation permease subunit